MKKESIQTQYDKTVYNIGCIGEGAYIPTHIINNKKESTIQYSYWINMFTRCYNKNELERHPTYQDKMICEEWWNFQNFGKWFDENYYTIDNETMCLDKDILVKDNKLYSPNTCIFVSKRINSLFTKRQNYRGNCPIGVRSYKNNKFQARCNVIENKIVKSKSLGYYNSAKEAFSEGYKPFKENYIKQVANEYKDRIPKTLYDAMYQYKVEITD